MLLRVYGVATEGVWGLLIRVCCVCCLAFGSMACGLRVCGLLNRVFGLLLRVWGVLFRVGCYIGCGGLLIRVYGVAT